MLTVERYPGFPALADRPRQAGRWPPSACRFPLFPFRFSVKTPRRWNALLRRLCLLFCLVPAWLTAAETRSGRVLILGDSVSVAYTPVVRELLKDVADVIRPAGTNGHVENCEG